MAVRRTVCMAWAIVLATGLTTLAAEAAPGAWIADRAAPTLYQRGRVYETTALLPRATTPVTGRAISRVAWRHDYGMAGAPVTGRLCGAGRCVDASAPRGISDAFAGLPPRTAFYFRFRVDGRGALTPARYGAPLQLVVNFE